MARGKVTSDTEYYLVLPHGGMHVPPTSGDKVALCVSYSVGNKRTSMPVVWGATFSEVRKYGTDLIELSKKKDDKTIAAKLGVQGTEFALWEQAVIPDKRHIIPSVVLDQRDAARPKI